MELSTSVSMLSFISSSQIQYRMVNTDYIVPYELLCYPTIVLDTYDLRSRVSLCQVRKEKNHSINTVWSMIPFTDAGDAAKIKRGAINE